MELSTFYGWIGVTSTALSDANEGNKDAAGTAWTNLSNFTILFVLIMLAASIGMAAYYYTGYNNQPNRHYQPKYWLGMWGASVVIVLALTFVLAFAVAKPYSLEGLWSLEINLALCNAIYAALFYLVISVLWCNCDKLPTNAYRYLKFKS